MWLDDIIFGPEESAQYIGGKHQNAMSQKDISKVVSGPNLAEEGNVWSFDNNLFSAIGEINELIKCYEKALAKEIERVKTITVDADAIMLTIANGLYAEVTKKRAQIDALKRKRAMMIEKIIKYSTLTVQELIWLLEQFEEYYKVINFGNRSFLVPLDFTLVAQGSHRYISEEEAQMQLMAHDIVSDGKSSYYTNAVPAYKIMDERIVMTNGEDFVTVRAAKDPRNQTVKYGLNIADAKLLNKEGIDRDFVYFDDTPSRIIFNEDMKKLAPVIELNQLTGIPFYRNNGDVAVPNGDAMNVIQKEEILSFIEYFIECKFDDESITLKKAFNEWHEIYVLGRKKG